VSAHLSIGPRLTRMLIALTAALGLTACTAQPMSEPATGRTVGAAVDYAAMERAIEDKISPGSLALSTINAVLVSVDGETKLAHYRNGSKPEDALLHAPFWSMHARNSSIRWESTPVVLRRDASR
jgi:hypothetical protein